MTDDQRAKILSTIHQFSQRPTLEPNEVTASDYAEAYGVTHQLAASRLKLALMQGKATVRTGIYDPRSQKIVNAYKLVEG